MKAHYYLHIANGMTVVLMLFFTITMTLDFDFVGYLSYMNTRYLGLALFGFILINYGLRYLGRRKNDSVVNPYQVVDASKWLHYVALTMFLVMIFGSRAGYSELKNYAIIPQFLKL